MAAVCICSFACGNSQTDNPTPPTGKPETVFISETGEQEQSLETDATRSVFFISPDGDDAGDGSEKTPWRTLEKARDMLRLHNFDMTDDFTVLLRGGEYALTETLIFGPEDSGTNGHRIRYVSYPGEKAVIGGGKAVTDWAEHDDPEKPGLWKADIPVSDGFADIFRQLYINGVKAERAQTSDVEALLGGSELFIGYVEALSDGPNPLGRRRTEYELGYRYEGGEPPPMYGWRNPSDIEFILRPTEWMYQRALVGSITEEAVFMRQPSFGRIMNYTPWGNGKNLVDRIENAYELLSEPGEWYLDRAKRVVYYLPREGEDMRTAVVEAPVLEGSLILFNGAPEKPVRGISFEGITFTLTNWTLPSRMGGYDTPQQANQSFVSWEDAASSMKSDFGGSWWTMARPAPGGVDVYMGHDIEFERCIFTKLGGAGLNLLEGCRNCVINGCVFTDIAGNGIQVGVTTEGTPPSENALYGNRVSNCYVSKVCGDYRGGCAVMLGIINEMTVANNPIYDVPYSGISSGWGWGAHIPISNNRIFITDNHVFDTNREVYDGGSVYTLGSHPDSVFSGNFVGRPLKGVASFYIDNGSSHITIEGNYLHSLNISPGWGPEESKATHINIRENYHRAAFQLTSNEGVLFEGNIKVNADEIPPGASAIIEKAGIRPEYRDIIPEGVVY